jgi:predicted RNA-binding Zn ribbon-like protein
MSKAAQGADARGNPSKMANSHTSYTSVRRAGSSNVVVVNDPATERFAAAQAPEPLRRVQSFLNTRATGRPPEPDLLERPGSANTWLRTLDWPTKPRLSADDLPPLRELREALQAEIEAGRGNPSRPQRSHLAQVLEKLRWKVTLYDGQLVLVVEGAGWRQVAGTVIGDMLVAQQQGTWPRLKACRNPVCSVIFYDSSKNQSRVWDNTSVCGNIHNLRAARARRRVQRA